MDPAKIHILVLDRNLKSVYSIQQVLVSIGYQVFVTTYESEAVALAEQKLFNLVVKAFDPNTVNAIGLMNQSGTGKDCAGLPENLLESELFGHVRGAFTGAISDRKGRFQLVHKGTLFLDEIADLSPKGQGDLLRVLEDGIFRRMGSQKVERVDARIIAATNKSLAFCAEVINFFKPCLGQGMCANFATS